MPIEVLWDSWETSLQAGGRSARTIVSYRVAVFQLDDYLDNQPVGEVTKRDIEKFLAALRETHASATVRQRYASLRQWFRWLAAEDEIESNPMRDMEAPKVVEKPVPVIPITDLRALIAACRADDDKYLASRDEALIRMFLDTGIRLDEMTRLKTSDVDRRLRVAVVFGKGSRTRTVAYDVKTAEALDRYGRRRSRHKHADLEAWWLGRDGALSSSGIAQVLKRRSSEAGIEPHIHPHQFRHTAAHQWLATGGNEGDLQILMGWSSPQMLRRYGSSAAAERAIEAKKRLGMWDEL